MESQIGRFGWHDMNTSEISTSEVFYSQLFGWTLKAEPLPNGYRMLIAGEGAFGGLFPWPSEIDERSQWTGFVVVEDVVDTANRAKSLGGHAPFDSKPIPGTGTLGVVIDPTGAPLTTFLPEQWTDAWTLGPGGTGQTVIWNELITTDLAASVAFHRDLFNWEVDQSVVDAAGYVIAKKNGIAVAGIFDPGSAPRSSAWITYFNVEKIDEVVERAQSLGATVIHEATDVPGVGRTAWLLDPLDATFGLMQPAEGWFERL